MVHVTLGTAGEFIVFLVERMNWPVRTGDNAVHVLFLLRSALTAVPRRQATSLDSAVVDCLLFFLDR